MSLFDNRTASQVKRDWENGKKNEREYMKKVVDTINSDPHSFGFTVVGCDELGKDERFYADGIGRPWKPDFKWDTRKAPSGGPDDYLFVEIKTSDYCIPAPVSFHVFVKKHQIDLFLQKYGDRAWVVIADPIKWTMCPAKLFKGCYSYKEPRCGDKEVYAMHKRFLEWHPYREVIHGQKA